MTEPASVGTASIEPVPAERAAPGAEAASVFRWQARAGGASGAPIDPEAWPTRAFLVLADVLGRYHRHQVVHRERLRRLLRSDRPVLLVGNHALDIVDPLLPNSFDVVVRTLQIMQYELGNIRAGEADVLVHTDLDEYWVLDFWKAAPMIAQGRKAAEATLPAIRERLAKLRGEEG